MKHTIYAIHYNANDSYHLPVFLDSDDEAIEVFETACRTEGTLFRESPWDYSMFCIGVLDMDTFKFESDIRLIRTAIDVINIIDDENN